MRIASLTRHRVDGLDIVGTLLVQVLVGQRDDVVLPHTRLQRFGDLLIGAVDHRGGLGQQQDLVDVLDSARVEHDLLAVCDPQTCALQLEQERRLDDIEADRRIRYSLFGQDALDLRDRALEQTDLGRDRASKSEHPGPAVLGVEPRRVQLVVTRGGAEVPDHWLPAARQQGVASHLVARPLADHRAREVSDVVDVEHEQRTEIGRLQGFARAGEPIRTQSLEVDSRLEIDSGVTRRRNER